MKIYISQSISGKTAKEYVSERKEIIRQIKMEYGDATKIVGSYVKDKWDIIDKAFFALDWKDDNNCVKEHEECTRRGIDIIYDGLAKTKTNREQLLDEAKAIVCGDRDQQYGTPEDNFEIIAKLWSAYLEGSVTPFDVAMMMVLFKVAREATGQNKRDNLIDIAGYAACAAECEI